MTMEQTIKMEATKVEAAPVTTINDPTSSSRKPFLQFPAKKKIRRGGDVAESRRSIPVEFLDASPAPPSDADETLRSSTPLVIPAVENQLKWKKSLVCAHNSVKEETLDHDTSAAIAALQDEASGGNAANAATEPSSRVIAKHANTFVTGSAAAAAATTATSSEGQQYQTDMEALPAELSEHDTAYQRTPIAEFGAALLRGMGWTEDVSTTKQADEAFPRPHRLGLGAIPAAPAPSETGAPGHRRGRRPDQYQRDQKVQQQNEMYQREREKQLAADKQRTIQNGSLVWINTTAQPTRDSDSQRRRARILKLVGVPGLNMVQIQYEGGQSTEECIKRHEIDRLVTRQELDESPFQEPRIKREIETETLPSNDTKPEKRKERRTDQRKERNDGSVKQERDHSSARSDNAPKKPQTWVVSNIRVRVVTKRLGRQYYKEKGVVVDVTSAGATLHMGIRDVLEGVPDRYLETALPKVGGNVIVLASQKGHTFDKGRLLERTSRHGVVQLFDDMSVLTVPLDDLAEWCGPLDDDEDR